MSYIRRHCKMVYERCQTPDPAGLQASAALGRLPCVEYAKLAAAFPRFARRAGDTILQFDPQSPILTSSIPLYQINLSYKSRASSDERSMRFAHCDPENPTGTAYQVSYDNAAELAEKTTNVNLQGLTRYVDRTPPESLAPTYSAPRPDKRESGRWSSWSGGFHP